MGFHKTGTVEARRRVAVGLLSVNSRATAVMRLSSYLRGHHRRAGDQGPCWTEKKHNRGGRSQPPIAKGAGVLIVMEDAGFRVEPLD